MSKQWVHSQVYTKILITEVTRYPQATLAMADTLSNEGIQVIVIGVGGAVDRTEADAMATSGQAFYVRDYASLSVMSDAIIDLLCQGASTAATEIPCGNSVDGVRVIKR